jgi:hypothetical protein
MVCGKTVFPSGLPGHVPSTATFKRAKKRVIIYPARPRGRVRGGTSFIKFVVNIPPYWLWSPFDSEDVKVIRKAPFGQVVIGAQPTTSRERSGKEFLIGHNPLC